MKQSKYTLQIPIDEGMLLFNTVNTGLVHLNESEKSIYFSLIKKHRNLLRKTHPLSLNFLIWAIL